MASASIGFAEFTIRGGRAPLISALRVELTKPLTQRRGRLVADKAMRRGGQGSVEDQFARKATRTKGGAELSWAPTKPFGRRKPGRATLVRTGSLRRSWIGTGPGAVTLVSPGMISIGVDRGRHPQAAMFQRTSAKTILITGKMRGFVRHTFGVNFRRDKTSISIEPRRVSINPQMAKRAGRVMLLDMLAEARKAVGTVGT